MNDVLMWLAVMLVGFALGLLFFGGLWWTVRRGTASAWPALWFVASMVVRVTLTLGGIYLVSDAQWQRLLASLLGFWLARALVFRMTAGTATDRAVKEVRHAP